MTACSARKFGPFSPSLFCFQRRQAYLQYMIDIAVALGADNENATEDMTNLIEFETAMANVRRSKALVLVLVCSSNFLVYTFDLHDWWGEKLLCKWLIYPSAS